MRLGTPLAAGENIAGEAAFAVAINSGALGVVQPDLGKWGGFSGGVPVARRIVERGRLFCPHWLGGGIGLLASAHLLGRDGWWRHAGNRCQPQPAAQPDLRPAQSDHRTDEPA